MRKSILALLSILSLLGCGAIEEPHHAKNRVFGSCRDAVAVVNSGESYDVRIYAYKKLKQCTFEEVGVDVVERVRTEVSEDEGGLGAAITLATLWPPRSVLETLSRDKNPDVRRRMLESCRGRYPDIALMLLADPDRSVRVSAASALGIDYRKEILDRIKSESDPETIKEMLRFAEQRMRSWKEVYRDRQQLRNSASTQRDTSVR
jgi:hypothetical protein